MSASPESPIGVLLPLEVPVCDVVTLARLIDRTLDRAFRDDEARSEIYYLTGRLRAEAQELSEVFAACVDVAQQAKAGTE